MNISKVEDFLGLTLSKEVLKKAVGDGMEFDLVYETMLNDKLENISSDDTENSSEKSDYTYTASGSGQKLDDIPLKIRTTPIKTGELVLEDSNVLVNNINNNEAILEYIHQKINLLIWIKFIMQLINIQVNMVLIET